MGALKLLPAPVRRLLLPAPPKLKQALLREAVAVPAGYVWPSGERQEKSFSAQIEAGVRWHPDWKEPCVHVTARRFLYYGDAIGCEGADVADYPVSEAVKRLAKFHGQAISKEIGALLDELGLLIPASPQSLATFVSYPIKFNPKEEIR